MAKTKKLPWAFLDDFRGADFSGEWPTLPELFTITTKRFGARPCFTDFEGEGGAKQTLTYEQVLSRVQTLAAWLCVNGVTKGDRVAVTGKNSPELAKVYLAAMFAGATVCPIDYALSPAETENLLNAAQPSIFSLPIFPLANVSEPKSRRLPIQSISRILFLPENSNIFMVSS